MTKIIICSAITCDKFVCFNPICSIVIKDINSTFTTFRKSRNRNSVTRNGNGKTKFIPCFDITWT